MWSEFPVSQPPAGFVLLPENGWNALILAVAGFARGVRCLKRSVPKDVTTIVTTTASRSPSRNKIKKIIDDFLDEFILVAGFDPRPRGYNGYFQLPKGITCVDELTGRLNAALSEEDTGAHPAQIRPLFERAIGPPGFGWVLACAGVY